jgi:hypothetical protein
MATIEDMAIAHTQTSGAEATPDAGGWRSRVCNAAELQNRSFPPMRWVVPSIVPEGATLLVSRPKLGKSWLMLDLAVAIAAGRFTLGEIKPAQGAVLYLALEDGHRRLQRRITKLLPSFNGSWPMPLEICTEWRRGQGGLADIRDWITSATSPRLIIIDTLAQFRPMASGKQTLYTEDYNAIVGLQKLASEFNIGIIIVHHDRKSEAEDVFDTASGSLGLTGAADTILMMKRLAGTVSLHVRGRDIEDKELALSFDKATCRWSVQGAAADVRRSSERKRVLMALENGPLGVKEIVLAAELKSRNAADQLIFKMVKDGEIVRSDRGQYALPEASPPDPSKIDKIRNSEEHPIEKQKIISADANLIDLTGDKDSAPTSQPDYPDLPAFVDRRANGHGDHRKPALGPVGDSLDDLEPPFRGDAA